MDRQLPTTELVIRDGIPVWLMQGGGVEAAAEDWRTAEAMFRQACESRGLQPPAGTISTALPGSC